MKKFFLLSALSIFTMTTIISCSDSVSDPINNQDKDTYSVVYDATGSFSAANNYTLIKDLPTKLYSTDVVLVYRKKAVDNGAIVWEQIPKTKYLTQGELDYDFDFTTSDIQIFTTANFDQATMNAADKTTYLNNQTFRMVIVPAAAGKSANVNYADYNSVINYYGINTSNVKKL